MGTYAVVIESTKIRVKFFKEVTTAPLDFWADRWLYFNLRDVKCWNTDLQVKRINNFDLKLFYQENSQTFPPVLLLSSSTKLFNHLKFN
jgi:hypothetical protein